MLWGLLLGTCGLVSCTVPLADQGVPGEVDEAEAPTPMAGADDWVQLVSGEWLKGEIKWMREDELSVDSDKLGDQLIDWEDVESVWTRRRMTCLFDDLSSFTGPLHVVGNQVIIESDPQRVMTRRSLLTIVQEGTRNGSTWSGDISLGLSSQSGNTDQQDYTGLISFHRDQANSTFDFEYAGQVSTVNDSETANNHYARASYTSLLSRRAYITPLYFDALKDRFKNIDYQLTQGVLAGYKVIDQKKQEWTAGAGFGVQATKYDSVSAGEDQRDTIPVFLLVTDYENELSDVWDLTISLSRQVEVGGAHENRTRLQAQASADLTDRFDLDFTLIWTRLGNPQTEADGAEPRNDDYSITFGLGYDF